MPLWGTTSEEKPKWLTDAEKKDVYATDRGWTTPAGGNGNANADREVLVAAGSLATTMGAATITGVEFVTTSASHDVGYNLEVVVRWNEAVDVTGNPTLEVDNDQTGGGGDASPTVTYSAGTGTHELTFSLTMTAGNTDIVANSSASDVLSFTANTIALSGGTILDAGTATASDLTISTAQATAGGTLTITD